METKIKDFAAKIFSLAKLKPVIFTTMIFNIVYGLVNVIISTVEVSLFIGLTGVYSIVFGIAKFYGLNNLKKVQDIKSGAEIAKIEKTSATNISIYAAVMSFLHFSLAVVCIFFFEENSNYAEWFIYFIAIAAIIKIILATINTVRTRKNHNVIIHHLKLMDFANALISLALLQRAIMYFTGYEHAGLIGGIGGVFFSLCAMLICLKMFLRFFERGNAKNGITNRLN